MFAINFYLEDRDSRFLRNVDNLLPNYTDFTYQKTMILVFQRYFTVSVWTMKQKIQNTNFL